MTSSLREALAARFDQDFIAERAPPRRARPRAPAASERRIARALGFARRHPLEIAVGAALLAAAGAIAWNALALQTARHPAPWFGRRIAAPLPPVRPLPPAPVPVPPAVLAGPAATMPASVTVPSSPRSAARDGIGDLIRSGDSAPAPRAPPPPARPTSASASPAPVATPSPRDAIGDLIRLGEAPPIPPAPIGRPDASTVAAAQRALARLNYLAGKPDGLIGPATRQALERFERDRKLPVTGDLSPRTARELAAASGVALD
jgi:hypothetical protein